jgi:hypothetical protein
MQSTRSDKNRCDAPGEISTTIQNGDWLYAINTIANLLLKTKELLSIVDLRCRTAARYQRNVQPKSEVMELKKSIL